MNTESATSASFGKYILEEPIGRGGMSEVFLARTLGLEGFQRRVALKRIFPQYGSHPEFIRCFIDEARVGGMLYHHNVVQTLDFGKEGDRWYIAMEYVEGTHLGAILSRCRERDRLIPPGIYLQLALQICEGLDYIHHASLEGQGIGLVHRDIKPSNMLVSRQGLVKITDFGVAKAGVRMGVETAVGALKGTIGYMAPEQARGQEVTPASDLFSLGALLFEMATLQRLYGEGDELVILNRVRDAAFRVPIESAGAYMPGLDKVLRRLLAFDPRDRYERAEDAAHALRALPQRLADRTAVVGFLKDLQLIEADDGEAADDLEAPPFARPGHDPRPSTEREKGLDRGEGVPGGAQGRDAFQAYPSSVVGEDADEHTATIRHEGGAMDEMDEMAASSGEGAGSMNADVEKTNPIHIPPPSPAPRHDPWATQALHLPSPRYRITPPSRPEASSEGSRAWSRVILGIGTLLGVFVILGLGVGAWRLVAGSNRAERAERDAEEITNPREGRSQGMQSGDIPMESKAAALQPALPSSTQEAPASSAPAFTLGSGPLTRVFVQSFPSGARVFVDGRFQGRTPLRIELREGQEFKLVLDGYRPFIRVMGPRNAETNAVESEQWTIPLRPGV